MPEKGRRPRTYRGEGGSPRTTTEGSWMAFRAFPGEQQEPFSPLSPCSGPEDTAVSESDHNGVDKSQAELHDFGHSQLAIPAVKVGTLFSRFRQHSGSCGLLSQGCAGVCCARKVTHCRLPRPRARSPKLPGSGPWIFFLITPFPPTTVFNHPDVTPISSSPVVPKSPKF